MNSIMMDVSSELFKLKSADSEGCVITAQTIKQKFEGWDKVTTGVDKLLETREFNQNCPLMNFKNDGIIIHCEKTEKYPIEIVVACAKPDDSIELRNQTDEYKQRVIDKIRTDPQLSEHDAASSDKELLQKLLDSQTYFIDLYSLMEHPSRKQFEFFEFSKVAFCIENNVIPLNSITTFSNQGQARNVLNERYVNGLVAKDDDLSTSFITFCLNSITLLSDFRDMYVDAEL